MIENFKDTADKVMQMLSDFPGFDATSFGQSNDEVQKRWTDLSSRLDAECKAMESLLVIWNQVDVLRGEVVQWCRQSAVKLTELKQKTIDKNQLGHTLKKYEVGTIF